jgi:hypothetical protein
MGPPNGPRPFDYVGKFDNPFPYDPSKGNLLVEFISSSGYSPPLLDDYQASSPGTWQVAALDANATVAQFSVPNVSVLQFTFVPEPTTWSLLLVTSSAAAIIAQRRRRR